MKEFPFQGQGLLPLTSKVRILKLDGLVKSRLTGENRCPVFS
jgi:hypothetical protein